jgi:hypothetical protein
MKLGGPLFYGSNICNCVVEIIPFHDHSCLCVLLLLTELQPVTCQEKRKESMCSQASYKNRNVHVTGVHTSQIYFFSAILRATLLLFEFCRRANLCSKLTTQHNQIIGPNISLEYITRDRLCIYVICLLRQSPAVTDAAL